MGGTKPRSADGNISRKRVMIERRKRAMIRVYHGGGDGMPGSWFGNEDQATMNEGGALSK